MIETIIVIAFVAFMGLSLGITYVLDKIEIVSKD